MLHLDATFFAFAVPAVLFAGISKAGFGSGAAFASAAVLAVHLEPGHALGVMLPLLMLIDFASVRPYWKRWSWPDARVLILAGVPGVALGALFFTWADADMLRLMIGAIALLFVVWLLASRNGWIPAPNPDIPGWVAAMLGVTTGFTSFVSHAGGPTAAIYLLGRRLDKTAYQATSVLVFLAINVAKFVPYAGLGLFTTQTVIANLILAPVALLGTWLGVKAHRILSESAFFALTYTLLAITGTKLVFDGLT